MFSVAKVLRSFSPLSSSITRSDLNFALKFLLFLDMTLNPFLCIDLSISDSLRSVRKSVLIYETIIDSVLIPVQPQYYAADGLMELLKVVKGIHQRFNPDLQIEGILFTMDNCRYNNAKRNKQAIKTTYGSDIKIFEQTIPRTESLAETASEGVSIFAYDGKSKGADSYLELVQEVLKHA